MFKMSHLLLPLTLILALLAGCSSGGGDTTQSTEAEQNDAATEAAEHLDPQALNGTNQLRLGVFSNARHGQVLLTEHSFFQAQLKIGRAHV